MRVLPLLLLLWAAPAAPATPDAPERVADPAWADSALVERPDGAPGPAGDSSATAWPGGTGATGASSDGRLIDWLWVTRSALTSPERVARVVADAESMGVRGLLVQVIGRGDAFYRSDRLPRAQALAGLPEDFDPLAELVARGHAAGLEVHAWINCCLVWSAPQRPTDPAHVVRLHPEWFLVLPDGRSLAAIGPACWHRLGIEGAFLSPSHTAARAWIAGNAAEVVRRYAVDGIHLDYIRTPGIDAGYDGASRVGFALEQGVDRARHGGRAGVGSMGPDSAFAAYQARQVTEIVRAVRDSVRAVRSGVAMSAAVRPDPREAARWYGQPWLEWLADGLLDRVFPMCYSPTTQTVLDQLVTLDHVVGRDRVIPGIAVYNAAPPSVASHCRGVRALGYPQLALYSYDALMVHPSYWERLHRLLAGSDSQP